jgi:hypothetical protein
MRHLLDYPLAAMLLFLLWFEKHFPSAGDRLAAKVFEDNV